MSDPNVPEVSLTAPCPCGSGRKYKRCCWAARKTKQAQERQARHEVANRVLRFAEQRAPGGYVRCRETVLAPLSERFGPIRVEDVLDRGRDSFLANLVDAYLGDEPLEDGRSPIELFLADPSSADLHPAARVYLEAWARTSLSLYEVEEVAPGEAMVLKDLLDDRLVRVLDRSASTILQPWEIIVTRVADTGAGAYLTGGAYYLKREAVSWFRQRLEDDRSRPEHQELTWPQFLRRRWRLVPQLWLELRLDRSLLPAEPHVHGPGCGHER